MEKISELTTVSLQVAPTSSAAISASAVVSMIGYQAAKASLVAHRLPDAKGEGVITATVYETTNTVLNGQAVSVGVVTGSITSASDVNLSVEISDSDLSGEQGYSNVYVYLQSSTPTVMAATVERGQRSYT